MKLIHSLLFLFVTAFALLAQNGVQNQMTYPGAYRPIFDEFPTGSPLTTHRPDKIDTITPGFAKDTLVVDFESRQVSYSRFDTLSGYPLWEFHYEEMSEYLKAMERHTRFALWNDMMVEKGVRKKKSNDDPLLRLRAPEHLPAWAQRILGKEPPQLSITGSQKIKVGVESSRASVGGEEDEAASNIGPIFVPSSNFVIRGSVGRLLKLEIRLSGETGKELFESAGDQINNIKIEYREDSIGELEDDIIQEVVIGKTSFNMPGQGLAGYSSGSNDGLFGVKVRSQIGPLSLTTIASIEQVEVEKKTINMNATNLPTTIGESGMAKNLYYFLDEVYRLKYLAKYADPLPYQKYLDSLKITAAPKIKRLEVYKYYKDKPSDSDKDFYYADFNYLSVGDNRTELIENTGVFEKLVLDEDYSYDSETGRIFFGSVDSPRPLTGNDVIGIYMEYTNDSIPGKGDLTVVYDSVINKNKYKDLWVLKSESSFSHPDNGIYNLMMRNVYSMASSGGTPEFKIERVIEGERNEKTEDGRYFAQILGLMNAQEVYNYSDLEIFDLEKGYVIIPPYEDVLGDTSYSDITALYPFSNPNLGTSKNEQNYGLRIYDDLDNLNDWNNRFEMVTVSKSRRTDFNLDFGVMEGTEKLFIDGQPLEKDVDYTIDYGFGRVDLISEKAKAAEEITAEYQKESLFFLENKVFLGINGKVDLPTIGRNSYFGTTFMWQLMTAKSLMPKVGTEPFDRFLFDANLELDFEPEWMTALVNVLPLISTDAASSARFSFEIAHSSAESSNKDYNDAYIDNFQTSSRNSSLGTNHRNWFKASPDAGWVVDDETFAYNPPAWTSYWFQPVSGDERVKKEQIYKPTDSDASSKNETIGVLRFVVQPFPDSGLSTLEGIKENVGGVEVSKVNPWAGITRGFTGSQSDRTEYRYLEFWFRQRSNQRGNVARSKLYIDLGQISEDISLDGQRPNDRADYEFVGEALTADKDLGIDALPDSLETYWYPDFTTGSPEWKQYGNVTAEDTAALGLRYVEDPGRDNWSSYSKESKNNTFMVNGTEGNRVDNSYPDDEDVNNDGRIYIPDGHFFRYEVDLANVEESDYYLSDEKAHMDDSGWVKMRIPVGDNATINNITRIIGSPSWKNIDHVRFLWHSFDSTKISVPNFTDTLEFAEMQFVGNLWREYVTDSSDIGKVTATIEDSKNTFGYQRPPEKRIERLEGSKTATDYTLVLDFDGIYSDSTVLAYRSFTQHQVMDLTGYEDVRFWAQDENRTITKSRDNWLVFRFGSNDSTYYEYKTRNLVLDTGSFSEDLGWASSEGIVVPMEKFMDLKNDFINTYGERVDTINRVWPDPETGDTLKIYSRTQSMPTASAVRWLAFGVHNNSGTDYISRVRINGLRATGVLERKGWAVRSGLDLEFSDFLTSKATYNYTDADFRSMSQDIHTNESSKMNSAMSGEMQLSKFLPDRAGVRLPIGASMSANLSRPETKANSDISLRKEDGKADGFSDMARDFANVVIGEVGTDSGSAKTEATKFQEFGKEYRIYTSYRKNNKSKVVPVNLTADRVGVEYSYNVKDNTKRNGEIPDKERPHVKRNIGDFHIDENETRSHNFTLDYDLSPTSNAKSKTSWSPFKKSKKRGLPRKVKSMKLNLLPSKVDFDLIKMNYSWNEKYNSVFEVQDTVNQYEFKRIEAMGVTHGFDFNYEPISPFTSMSFTMNSKRDFNARLKNWGKSGVGTFMSEELFQLNDYWRDYYFLQAENDRSHTSQFRITPDFFNWLSTSATLSSNYTQKVDIISDTSFLNGTMGSKFRFETTLRTRRLFESMAKIGKSGNGFSKTMKAMAKGLDKVDFESFSFSYNANMSLNSTYMDSGYVKYGEYGTTGASTSEYYLHTLGFNNRSFGDLITGDMDDKGSFAGVQNRDSTYWVNSGRDPRNSGDTRNTTQDFGLRTSLKLPNPIDVSINTLSLNWRRTYKRFTNEFRMDTSITWPEIKVSASTPILKKIPQVNQNFRSMNLRSGYTYSKTTNRTSENFFGQVERSNPIKQNVTYRYGMDPLFKIDGVLKKRKIDMGYSMSLLFDTTISSEEKWLTASDYPTVATSSASRAEDEAEIGSWGELPSSGSKKITTDHTWTAGYKLPGKKGKTFDLFRGSRVVEVKGDWNFNLNVTYKRVRNYDTDHTQKEIDVNGDEVSKLTDWDDSYFTLSPSVEYDFTKNIGFLLYYKLTNQTVDPEERYNHNAELAAEITINF